MTIVAAHLVLLLGPPLISQDVFGYLDFARLGALHGLDPYTHVAAQVPTDSDLPIRRLALPALSLWPAVHARELRDRAARARRRAVGVEGARGRLEPRARSRWSHARPAEQGHSPRWAAAFVGLNPVLLELAVGGAHNDTLLLLALAGALAAHGRREPALGAPAPPRWSRGWRSRSPPGWRCRFSCSRRHSTRERLRVAGARRAEPGCCSAIARADRLRLARVRLHQRRERAAAAGGDPQHARRDRAPGGTARHAELVAPLLHRRVRRGLHIRPVAHPARGRLARGGRVDDAGAAAVHRLAVALVCDLAAAASRGQWRSAPARRHARLLCLRAPDPPAARQRAAQPAAGHLPHAERLCSPTDARRDVGGDTASISPVSRSLATSRSISAAEASGRSRRRREASSRRNLRISSTYTR